MEIKEKIDQIIKELEDIKNQFDDSTGDMRTIRLQCDTCIDELAWFYAFSFQDIQKRMQEREQDKK